MVISSKTKYVFAIVLFLLFVGAPFVFAAPVTEVPTILFPPPPPAEPAQDVPTLTFFKWQEVANANVYAYTLRAVGGDAPPQFTNGVGGVPDGEVWIQPTLAVGTEYTFSVQGCEVEDINLCGPASTLTFKTVVPVVVPPDEVPPVVNPLDLNPISSQTLPQLLENVLNFLFGLSMVILPIIILYGGILLLTAGGDPQKISQSRTILLWAVIAFAIILLARGLPPVLRGLL